MTQISLVRLFSANQATVGCFHWEKKMTSYLLSQASKEKLKLSANEAEDYFGIMTQCNFL